MSFAAAQHSCTYRRDQHRYWQVITNYWLLPAHFVCSAGLGTALLYYINGRSFLVSSSMNDAPSSVVPIYQSTITTLLSIAITTVRMLAGAWLTLAGWRLAFIMLEVNGTTLHGFSRLVRYRLPPRDSIRARHHATLWLLFAASLPVQFIAPFGHRCCGLDSCACAKHAAPG